jgi:23S rRNA (adenine2503-C2)-methyltransferase
MNDRINMLNAQSVVSRYSKEDRERLEILHTSGRSDLAEVMVARFNSGRVCEFVDAQDSALPKGQKWIINLSTQFGCPVGCPYCDAGGGYRGDLSCAQLLAMVDYVLRRNSAGLAQRCAKLKVHFSRMGEPALNDAVLDALCGLREKLPHPGVWACVATTAPRNRHVWFESLREIKTALFPGRFQLQFSLNTTDEAARKKLVPIAHCSFAEIAAYGRRFHRPGDRKVVLNFALAADVPFDPRVIEAHFAPETFAVKLTPINPTAAGKRNGFATILRSERETALHRAVSALRARSFDVVISVGDAGEDEIGSNCGQALRLLHPQTTAETAITVG